MAKAQHDYIKNVIFIIVSIAFSLFSICYVLFGPISYSGSSINAYGMVSNSIFNIDKFSRVGLISFLVSLALIIFPIIMIVFQLLSFKELRNDPNKLYPNKRITLIQIKRGLLCNLVNVFIETIFFRNFGYLTLFGYIGYVVIILNVIVYILLEATFIYNYKVSKLVPAEVLLNAFIILNLTLLVFAHNLLIPATCLSDYNISRVVNLARNGSEIYAAVALFFMVLFVPFVLLTIKHTPYTALSQEKFVFYGIVKYVFFVFAIIISLILIISAPQFQQFVSSHIWFGIIEITSSISLVILTEVRRIESNL